ncbi:MAG: hypothetical protein IAF94_20545 [Pirellulaceae bacterium]|nr:hypothetical protein [Pirellulaceae bacterium]
MIAAVRGAAGAAGVVRRDGHRPGVVARRQAGGVGLQGEAEGIPRRQASVDVSNPLYSTPINTQLTSSTAVIANDFEAESQAYTASVVTNPANGTLNSFNSSTGQFSYMPTTNFVGIDTFVYKINNGTYDSNYATSQHRRRRGVWAADKPR